MSVDLMRASSTGIERQTPGKKPRSVPPPRSPDSGNRPKAEIFRTQNKPAPFLIPEHEVKVQWDEAADRIMIYQVLDKQSGDLVLQVPSAEVLSRIHQTQELLRRIAARGKASVSAPVVKEEKNNGN